MSINADYTPTSSKYQPRGGRPHNEQQHPQNSTSHYFSILQANLGKGPTTQSALFNDETLKHFAAIVVQEPHCFRNSEKEVIAPPAINLNWYQYLPSANSEESRFPIRACMWIHKDIKATRIPIRSPDLVAACIHLTERTILLVSAYIPPIATEEEGSAESHLTSRLSLIYQAFKTTQVQFPTLELIITGDFNRHDSLWGGDSIGETARQGEAQPIITLIEELDLQSLLPRGTPTYEKARYESTIDLVLVSPRLAEERTICDIWPQAYGSDHNAIYTTFDLEFETAEREPRLLLKNAPWEAIKSTVQESLKHSQRSLDNIDNCSDRLLDAVTDAIRKHCPTASPSKYAKRWWTSDLTVLRQDYTRKRNRARAERRAGLYNETSEREAVQAKRVFHKTARQQKKNHWLGFIADETNIWKAARYLDPSGGTTPSKISSITTAEGQVVSDESIASELLTTFFPPLPPVNVARVEADPPSLLSMIPLQIADIERAVFDANPNKAPGIDGIPMIVWRMLWPVLKYELHHLFSLSIRQGRLATSWKAAKIIPVRKAGKPDYTKPNAYRPISLLSTLSKLLEAVVAERISYLVETHSLIPSNHFGARKQRSTIHALQTIQEKTFQAWRNKRTLSLVTFDVKGAYNGVSKEYLIQRLRSRQVPEQLIAWIGDFCSERKASIVVNGYVSKLKDIPQAGLPQGSPLSPILFLFFNADIVQSKISSGGSVAFVDDYTAWVIGSSAKENTQTIQLEVIPMLEKWEKESGAVFEALKTQFIHFTRNKNGERLSEIPIIFKGSSVTPAAFVKVLGVIMDQQLRYKLHAARVAKRGLIAATALRRLRGLLPRVARQLFTSTVAPVVDYASPIWYPTLREQTLKILQPAQRVGAQAIINGFKTVSLPIAEAEAGILPLRERLFKAQQRHYINLKILPRNHPCNRQVQRICRRFTSPLQKTWQWFREIDTSRIETIKPFCIPPWQKLPRVVIFERRAAVEEAIAASALGKASIFVNGSTRRGLTGIGVYSAFYTFQHSETTGTIENGTLHSTELQAILKALRLVEAQQIKQITRIFSNSHSALKSIARPIHQAGQAILNKIVSIAHKLRVSFEWAPRDNNVKGISSANRLAKLATRDTCIPPSKQVAVHSAVRREAKKKGLTPSITSFTASTAGSFTRKLDKALPRKHVRLLYDRLPAELASILCQMRTAKSRLNSYLVKIKAVDSDICLCGKVETIEHFLFECPRWTIQRQLIRNINRQRWGDTSYHLGGWTSQELDGELDKWQPNIKAVRATIDFAKSTGRLDYKPDSPSTLQYSPTSTSQTSSFTPSQSVYC